MSEGSNMSFEGRTKQFEIVAPTVDDAHAIGPMQLQAWIETYQNPELGVDEGWIRKEIGYVADENGDEFRRKLFARVEADDKDIFYRVAKDQSGEVVGFCHAEKHSENPENVLEGLYLLASAQGEGLGYEMMKGALDWLGSEKPVKLTVIQYNKKAIDFYSRFGFEVVQGKVVPFKGPVTAVDMIRESA